VSQILWKDCLGGSLELCDRPSSDFLHRGALGLGFEVLHEVFLLVGNAAGALESDSAKSCAAQTATGG
jgi:hypothetical protein